MTCLSAQGSCYSLVVPRQDRKVDAIAFSQDEAIKHCKAQGGHLMDINSQVRTAGEVPQPKPSLVPPGPSPTHTFLRRRRVTSCPSG